MNVMAKASMNSYCTACFVVVVGGGGAVVVAVVI